MNFRQMIQTGPVKANELFEKLSQTSSGALKTRERLFGELKAELEFHADLEEKHLFPVLRKHKETRDLVPDASKGNKELRAQLAELDRLPKDAEAFPQKLAELKKGFQQHIRDEKKELLPAVQKALSDEEKQAVAEKIETAFTEAEQAKRDEAEQRKADAKRARETAERQAAAQEAAEQARRAAERRARETARDTAAATARTAESALAGAPQIAERATDGAQRRAEAMVLSTTEAYRTSTRTAVQELQDVAAVSTAMMRGMAEIQSTWMALLGSTMSANTQASQQLLHCRTVQQVAELQSAFFADGMRRWMESNAHVLELSQRVAGNAVRDFEGRLKAASEPRHSSR